VKQNVTPYGGSVEVEHSDEELREYAALMAEAERIARFGVWRWEIGPGRVHWSEALERIYGLGPGEFAGTVEAFVSYLHPDDRERIWAAVDRAVTTLEPFVWEERIIRADGKERVLLSQGRPIPGPDARATALVGICHDVTDRVEAQRALGHSERRMRAIIDSTPSIVAVKDLNGRYLMSNAEIGRLLGVHPDDLVGQYCTDLFPDIAEQLRTADRRAAAEMEPIYDETVLVVGGEPRTFETVTFALADEAGRPIETCTIATDVTERRERETERRERLRWEERIGSALLEDRMRVFTQPVIDLGTGEPRWHELLVRMRDPGRGGRLRQPDAFLPAAERFGLIQAIDVWMVRRALGLAPSRASEVNLSAVTLCDTAAREEIIGLLRAAPDAARQIVFEITETAAAQHLDAARVFATELSELGCGLALDDFGTGFGSFTYLRKLPLRYLKIDASFVLGLANSRDDRRVVRSIISIAGQFGLRTIAEGVEDEETLEILRELGADYAQGFHLGRPVAVRVGRAARAARTGRAGRGQGPGQDGRERARAGGAGAPAATAAAVAGPKPGAAVAAVAGPKPGAAAAAVAGPKPGAAAAAVAGPKPAAAAAAAAAIARPAPAA
jgi:PAS domain S-box-containing protein